MEFNVFQESLSTAIGIVNRMTASRATLAVLGHLLIEANENNTIRICGTNLEEGVSIWLNARVHTPGSITLPARLLAGLVDGLPQERMTLHMKDPHTWAVDVRCGKHKAHIKGIAAVEFPMIPTLDDLMEGKGLLFDLPSNGLETAIRQVAFSCAEDASRPMLSGIEMRFNGDLQLTSTDGYRLSRRIEPLKTPLLESASLLLPKKALTELARLLPDCESNGAVRVRVNGERHQVLFQVEGKEPENRGAFRRVEIVTQLIDGKYPDVDAVIPKSCTTRMTIKREAWLHAARVADLFAADSQHALSLHLAPANGRPSFLKLEARSDERGHNEAELEATVEGEALDIVLNARYLINVLSTLSEDDIIIEATSPNRPVSVIPAKMKTGSYLHILMPMHPPTGQTPEANQAAPPLPPREQPAVGQDVDADELVDEDDDLDGIDFDEDDEWEE